MKAAQDDYFVGRQPILDSQSKIYGYELLFRGGLNPDYAEFDSASQATATVIRNAMMNHGLTELVGDAKAFINFPEEFLSNKCDPCFHSSQVVIEVLEDVPPTEAVVASIKYLKELGYVIALDDFIFKKKFVPFIQMADIIKFDVENLSPEKLKPLFDKVKSITNVIILAERVETLEMFEACKAAGADLFQGYYFAKPEIVSGKQLGVGKVHVLSLLGKIVDESLHLDDLESVIERDVGLSLKLLRMADQYRTANMPVFNTLKEVMKLFGLKRVQSWATMMSLTALNDVIPEVFNLARLRAIFMRNVAQHEQLPSIDSFYLAGLFSMLDVIIGQHLEDALMAIPINENIKQGLLNGHGEYGRLLNVAESFEKNSADEHQHYAIFYFDALKEVNALN